MNDEVLGALWGKIERSRQAVAAATEELNSLYQALAELTCPFKVGEVLLSNVGLGRNGLVVSAITSPPNPYPDNTWMVQCFALSKAGAVTQRTVGVQQIYADSDGLRRRDASASC